jgi:hypothetical protein
LTVTTRVELLFAGTGPVVVEDTVEVWLMAPDPVPLSAARVP